MLGRYWVRWVEGGKLVGSWEDMWQLHMCSMSCRRFVARWILICVLLREHSWGGFDMFYHGEQKCVDAEELRAGGEDSDLI